MATAFDKAKWHAYGNFPADLSYENAATHIGFMLSWLITRSLENPDIEMLPPEPVEEVRARALTGRDVLLMECDGALTSEDVGPEAEAFLSDYYTNYLADYERLFAGAYRGAYYVEDTWVNADLVASMLDERFAVWRRRRGKRR